MALRLYSDVSDDYVLETYTEPREISSKITGRTYDVNRMEWVSSFADKRGFLVDTLFDQLHQMVMKYE